MVSKIFCTKIGESPMLEQQHPRVRHQAAGDREHLLLAPRQGARHLGPPLLEHREHVERPRLHVGDPSLVVAEKSAEAKVLQNRQPAEDAPALRHLDDALGHDAVRR
jgi:hypothetical protein